jgi:hypothetical protein
MSFELLQMQERLLKALLHDVFSVGLIASESHGGAQHLRPVAPDQNVEGFSASAALGRRNERSVIFLWHSPVSGSSHR